MLKFLEKAPFVPVECGYEVGTVLHRSRSRFQEIMVIENPDFGRMLILDGVVQVTESDEFFYHEMMTHVALHAHPDPKNVIVIGGGDGGIVREVLKHKSVKKVHFVEIDKDVIEVSKKFFPQIASGCADRRVEISAMDGAEFVKKAPKGRIDAIIVDSTDIIGFARSLYTKEFFAALKRCLSPDGMFVTHSESLAYHRDTVVKVQQTLKRAFPVVDLYTGIVPTYPGFWWTYAIGSMSLDPRQMRRPFKIQTKYYDDEIHAQCFATRKLYGKLMENKLGWGIKGAFNFE
ncbi:MAG: polyamine aminopropyltransferase [Nitrospiraceae bacterium]|nr:polyamine aminopropyltransferase [Nitrospiraceae bacterium]